MNQFSKPPKTIPELISILEGKGIANANPSYSERVLQCIPYYKLSGYIKSTPEPIELFDVIKTYELDMEIRNAIFGLLAHYEIALKNSFVNLTLQIDENHIRPYQKSHFYLSDKIFKHDVFNENLKRIEQDIEDNHPKLKFIDSYKSKYDNPKNPPIWMLTELMSFGDICRWIKSINHQSYINIIPHKFGFKNVSEFNNVIMVCTNLRNMCAHHSRLWENDIYGKRVYLSSIPTIVKNTLRDNGQHKKLWNSTVLVIYSLSKIGYKGDIKSFINLLCNIFEDYSTKHHGYGFPDSWKIKLENIIKETQLEDSEKNRYVTTLTNINIG